MTERKMVLIDAEAFGKIIKEWARDPSQRPEFVEDFNKKVGVSIASLEGYALGQKLNYVDLQADSLGPNVIIPALVDMEAAVPPGNYPLPDFYSLQAFDKKLPNILDQEKFKLSRIADYSFAKCQ